MKMHIFLSCICLFLLTSCDDTDYWGLTPGQPAGEETYGWFSVSVIVNYLSPDYRKLTADSCVHVNSIPLKGVTLTVSLPPQVEILEGSLKWHGDVAPNSERCMPVIIMSKTDIKDWAHPISLHVEGLYEGKRVSQNDTWGYNDYLKERKWAREFEEKRKQRPNPTIWERLRHFVQGRR